jgi:SAM-dependent methyltransferase
MPFPHDLSHYSDPDDYFVEHGEPKDRVENFAAIIRAAQGFGAFAPMLDIGCGRGESLAAAARLGWEARGVEPSAEFAIEGRRELGVAIDVGTVEGRYSEASFGLVLLSGVLEHVYEPRRLLAEAQRVLAPGGLLYIDVPNERSLLHRCARIAFRATGRDWTLSLSPTFAPYHVVGWSPRPLRRALASAGLELVALRGYPLRWIGGGAGYIVERAAAPLKLSAGLIAWAKRPS